MAKIQNLVESAHSLVAYHAAKAEAGEVSVEAAQDLAKQAIKSLRYDEKQYFWINDMTPRVVMHPLKDKLIGKDMSKSTDAAGKHHWQEFVQVVKASGGGFVPYEYQTPDGKMTRSKISYLKGFTPWGWIIGTGIYIDDVNAVFLRNLGIMAAAALVVLGLVVGTSMVIGRGISGPITKLTNVMARLADGEIDVDIPGRDRSDEIGEMSAAVDVFRHNTVEKVRLESEQAESERNSSNQRAHAKLEVLTGMVKAGVRGNKSVMQLVVMGKEVNSTQHQAQSMAAAVEEMVTSIKQISDTSNNATEDARQAESAAAEGVSSAAKAVETMEQIVDAVDTATGEVNTLAEESEKIGEIVSQIEDIAEQTNLLALNATIEAARAGDAGKGFAVVASEVKNLANQTARSTEDIRVRIESLRSKMSEIVTSMERGSTAVAQGREVVSSMGTQLEGISERVDGVTVKMAEVSGILAQQTAAANDVSEGTGKIADVATSNSNEIVDVLNGMDELSRVLNEQIGTFAELGVDKAILEITKNDHVMFVKRVCDAVLGRAQVAEGDLPDHHLCRLGKWYDNVENPVILGAPAYKALLDPHKQVHDIGKEILRQYHSGDPDVAIATIPKLSEASDKVVGLLDQLLKAVDGADRPQVVGLAAE
jgi:methyl-accepting chemotaxis protein